MEIFIVDFITLKNISDLEIYGGLCLAMISTAWFLISEKCYRNAMQSRKNC